MNEEQLTTLMEKVLTLNVNANTNVDIQKIINDFMIYKTATQLGTSIIWFLSFLILVFVLARGIKSLVDEIKKDNELAEAKAIKSLLLDYKKMLDGYDDWDHIKELNKKVDEVIAYMPRNKTRRK